MLKNYRRPLKYFINDSIICYWCLCFTERPVGDEERPYAILQQWGIHRDEVYFYLRHEPPVPGAPDGGYSDFKNKNNFQRTTNH